MNLSLGQLLYAYSYHDLDIDERHFYDKDVKEFIRAMKRMPNESIKQCSVFGDISPEIISKEAFVETYNAMVFTPLVNEKCQRLKELITFQHDWAALAEEFPEAGTQCFRINNIKNPMDLVLEDVTFYSFFPEWDKGFRGLRDDDFIVYFAPPKCISGSAYIPYSTYHNDRRINHRGGTLRDLYHIYNNIDRPGRGNYSRRNQADYKYTTLSSNKDGLLYHNNILNVTYSGMKEVYEIQTVSGNTLRATEEHLILTDLKNDIYSPLKDLGIGSIIYSKSKNQGKSSNKSRVNRREILVKNYPTNSTKAVNGHTYKRLLYSNFIFEAWLNKLSPQEYQTRLNSNELDGLLFIDTSRLCVHHKDRNPLNDDLENLQVMTKSGHKKLHYEEVGLRANYYLVEDKIISKRFIGLEDTYDISMDGEDNNFLADNILVHNCGKSTITAYFAYEAIKAGIPIGVYPTELTISTTLKYIFGYEYGLRGDEALVFFDGYLNENGIIEGAHKEEFRELLERYNHLIFMPPTNRFNWNDYEALYESDAKFIFHDNFIKSLSQLGLGEDATSASQFARKLSDTQHKFQKCFAKDTPVLMADGSAKAIQDIHKGDLVMGKDSTPRKVLSSYKGVDTLYQVDQLRGMSYTVNSRHDLVLKEQINNKDPHYKETILTAKELFDYQQSVELDRKYQGISVSWDLPEANLPIDPYILGLWLGDGTSMRPDLTTQDPEIRDVWVSYGETLGLVSREYTKKGSKATTYRLSTGRKGKGIQNYLLNALRDLNILNNKHIPDSYIRASRSQRLLLLAGLIDTDGHKIKRFKSRYTISTVSKGLADTLEFLLNSLNLKVSRYFHETTNANHSNVYELHFYGDLRECPIKLEYKQCTEFTESTNPLKVTKLEEGRFYGFECDGDHQFLLSDGTVVHNTTFLVTQEAMREATPKELETAPTITEYGKGHTFLTRSLLQESSLALHIKRRPNTQIRDLIVKNDRFRGLNDGSSTMFAEVTNRGKLRVTMAKDSIKESLIRAERKLFESTSSITDDVEECV